MSARTARRKRKIMANGYKHIARIGRPKYPGPTSKAKTARMLERMRERLARGAKA